MVTEGPGWLSLEIWPPIPQHLPLFHCLGAEPLRQEGPARWVDITVQRTWVTVTIWNKTGGLWTGLAWARGLATAPRGPWPVVPSGCDFPVCLWLSSHRLHRTVARGAPTQDPLELGKMVGSGHCVLLSALAQPHVSWLSLHSTLTSLTSHSPSIDPPKTEQMKQESM